MSQELRYDPKFPTSIWSGDGEVWLASTNCETGGKLEQRAALAERIVQCANSHAQLERTNAALFGALKDAEHLCKWLLQSDIPQGDRERVIRENGINFAAAIAEAESLEQQKERKYARAALKGAS